MILDVCLDACPATALLVTGHLDELGIDPAVLRRAVSLYVLMHNAFVHNVSNDLSRPHR